MQNRTVVPCASHEMLCWFLEHTDFSIVYAGIAPSVGQFPKELHQLATNEKAIFIDLAITSSDILSGLTNLKISIGSTAIFVENELIAVHVSPLAEPVVQLFDLILNTSPEYRQIKQDGRAMIVKPLIQKAITSTVLGADKSTIGKHKWTDDEMEQTIDLYLSFQKGEVDSEQAIKNLAHNLNLSVGQVSMAVNAVGTLDPNNPRRYPRPSKRLEHLWKKRGF